MKVGIDVRELEKGKITGIGRYLLNFLRSGPVREKGWEFILFANQDTDVAIEAPHIKKVFITEYVTFWWDQVQLPQYLKKERVDIFLTPYFKAPIFVSCKLVLIINDLIPLLFPGYQNPGNILSRIYFKELLKRAIRRADRIITISQHSKKDIIKVFGIAEDKIKVIALATDERFRKIGHPYGEALSKYGIDKQFILYFGNFSPHKNVRVLIEAYHGLPDNLKEEYKLVLAGKKDRYQNNLSGLVRSLGLDERVIFTDFVPDEDLPSLYCAASVFVFPSLYEGFGLPVLEAMACGTPVIALRVSSLPEVVQDAGIMIDDGNPEELAKAIKRILLDAGLREDLIKKGLNRAGQFSVEKMSGDFLSVLEDLIKEH